MSAAQSASLHAVILAGGRGTRFWPRSRKRTPKQLLPVMGRGSLLEQTVERLSPLVPPDRIWVLTNEALQRPIRKMLPDVPREQIIAEPVQRNTGPAIALAAKLIAQRDADAVMGVFPSDHLIAKNDVFLRAVKRAAKAARQRELIVFGIEPRHPETGYGYIEFPRGVETGAKPWPVVRFREKPDLATAKRFVKAGKFFWNSGMFVWGVQTISKAAERFMPQTARTLDKLAPLGSRRFQRSLRELYGQCDDISIDYGVLEKADNIVGFACKDFGWNDIGSWAAVYELAAKDGFGNVENTPVELLDASGNYVDAPGKLVALVGVHDLVVVDTPDALLICPREQAQKVSALVKALEKAGWEGVL